jgi:hypothetical protein
MRRRVPDGNDLAAIVFSPPNWAGSVTISPASRSLKYSAVLMVHAAAAALRV